MRIVYAARVTSPHVALAGEARRRITDWLQERHPYDDRAAGTAVTVTDIEGWMRVVVDQHVDASVTSRVAVAVRSDLRGLAFEARQIFVPRSVRVSRRSVPPRDVSVPQLVAAIVDMIGAVDAGVPIRSSAHVVRGAVDAAGVAALCEAPSRSLPVIVETSAPSGELVLRSDVAGRALAGLAHVVVLADDTARRAFNEAWGADLLQPSALAVVWPDRGDVQTTSSAGLTPQGAQRLVVDVIESVIGAAAGSLPELPRARPLQAPTARSVSESPSPVPVAEPAPAPAPSGADHGEAAAEGAEMVTMAELLGALHELEQAWNRVDDLQGAVALADAMVAQANARADRLESQINQLVSAKVDLEIRLGRKPDTLSASSPADALARATALCRHLDFAGDYSAIGDLSGVDPSALLLDLVRLDSVAVQWMTGDITDTTFALACRNVGLDFASGVSDTAERQYAEDYAVTWRGRTVHAVAHIRRGKGVHLYRVHVYLDKDERRVVVGHIGRHLRGRRD